jgi:two-component system OmpR family response regulator
MATILVIDDSATVIAAVEQCLGGAGYRVIHLESFIHLPQLLHTQPPDLIVLDLNMPHLSGLTFGEFIRKFQSREIPILINSSSGDAEVKAAVIHLKAAGAVKKGDPADLIRQVRATLAAQGGIQ